jgi:carbonic anhydrase/acetyltransferase-like protein (isoleucine patch superfamily)
LYEIDGMSPVVDDDAFVHPDAVIIGDVTIGAHSSVWPGAVLRGDFAPIVVGERTSIQDGSVIHAAPAKPTSIGSGCVIGHLAHLESCILQDRSMAGSGSVVLHLVIVETGGIVGANAVAPNGMVVTSGMTAVGIPARLRPGKMNLAVIEVAAEGYVQNAARYRKSLKQVG